jgi:hypothetical protein
MKMKLAFVFVILNAGFLLRSNVALGVLVRDNTGAVTGGSPLDGSGASGLQQQLYVQQKNEWEKEYQAEIIAAEQEELNTIYSKDPWRNIEGKTNIARGAGWVEFQGTVQESTADGTVLKGKWGPVLTIFTSDDEYEHLVTTESSAERFHFSSRVTPTTTTDDQIATRIQDSSYQRDKIYGDDLFFVQGFPYPATPRLGYEKMLALDSDYYSYANSLGQPITVHKLIYGKPCLKIWSPEELAALQQKANAQKQDVQDAALKFNQSQADKGDAFGLLRMGERYRDGDGVPKDLEKAKDYFTKATAAGCSDATNELAKLSSN